jgi:hypothetical protein
MNYVQVIIENLKKYIPKCPEDLLGNYAQLVLTKGLDTTMRDVHDAWSVWQNKTRPDHKSLIEFELLSDEVRELDRKYMDAIIKTWYDVFHSEDCC